MKHQAIRNLYPNVVMVDDGTGAFDINGNQVVFDEELVSAEIQRLKKIYESKQYQRNRQRAYPSLEDQLDMQYWDGVNGTTVWADTIAAVKENYPKPEQV